jgi:hypothetical protein
MDRRRSSESMHINLHVIDAFCSINDFVDVITWTQRMKFLSTWMLVALSSMAGCQLLVSFNGVAETGTQCDDTIDNDRDGRTDCDDPSCTGSMQCLGNSRDGGSALDASMTTMDGAVVMDGMLFDANSGMVNHEQQLDKRNVPTGVTCTTAGTTGNDRKIAVASNRAQYVVVLCGSDLYVAAAPAPDPMGLVGKFEPLKNLPPVAGVAFGDAEIAAGANGVVHVAGIGRTAMTTVVYHFRSQDFGASWSTTPVGSFSDAVAMSIDAKNTKVAIGVARQTSSHLVYFGDTSTQISTNITLEGAYSDIAVRFDPFDASDTYYVAGQLQTDSNFPIRSLSGSTIGTTRLMGGRVQNPTIGITDSTLIWGDDSAADLQGTPLAAMPGATPIVLIDFNLPPLPMNEHRSMSVSANDTVLIAQVDQNQPPHVILHYRLSSGHVDSQSIPSRDLPRSPSVVALPGEPSGGYTVVWTDGANIRTFSSTTP